MFEYVTYEQNNNMCYDVMKDCLNEEVKPFNHLEKESQAFILNLIISDAHDPQLINSYVDELTELEEKGIAFTLKAEEGDFDIITYDEEF